MSSVPITPAQLQALITSIPIHCATTVFSVAGQTFTAPQAVAFLTTVLNAHTAVTAARVARTAAIQALEKSNTAEGAVAREIREAVELQFSNSTVTLNEFAIAPRKQPKPLTPEALAARAAKAKATRLARGTTSKKKKAQISGNVTGVTITPITEPAASAPAATAPAAPSPATPATGGSAAAAPATHS